MSFVLFEKIIAQIVTWPEIPTIYLNMFGEPLMDKGLEQKMRLLKKSGLAEKIYFNTNAQLLTQEIAAMLLENEIGQIVPCLDSANPETFERIRAGADFQSILNNIISFAALRDKIHPETKICIQCVRTTLNFNDHEAIYQLLYDHLGGNDTLSVTTGHTWASPFLMAKKEFLASVGKEQLHFRCNQLHNNLIILADGIITPCCLDYNLELCGAIGDANRESLETIWNNPFYENLAEKIKNAINLPQFCKRCSFLFSDYTKFNNLKYKYADGKIVAADHGILISFKK
jgi:radical SAM protein with 4Fe4S-binding SPASM domain